MEIKVGELMDRSARAKALQDALVVTEQFDEGSGVVRLSGQTAEALRDTLEEYREMIMELRLEF